MTDLNALSREHMEKARTAKRGHSARLFLHDGPLRQTLIAMTTGSEVAEHEAPPAASLHVLHGRIRLVTGGKEQEYIAGQICAIPHKRHGLHAVSDAVVLLTTVSETPTEPRS